MLSAIIFRRWKMPCVQQPQLRVRNNPPPDCPTLGATIFQSLEKLHRTFQPLKKYFDDFPTHEKTADLFSRVWNRNCGAPEPAWISPGSPAVSSRIFDCNGSSCRPSKIIRAILSGLIFECSSDWNKTAKNRSANAPHHGSAETRSAKLFSELFSGFGKNGCAQ
jgi:hypothetical protein